MTSSVSCRVCRQPTGSLSLSLRTANSAFVDLFNDCTRLDATVDDPLPQFLCLPCAEELQRFGEFLSRARESDLQLRDLLPTGRLKAEQQVSDTARDPLEESDGDQPGIDAEDDDDDDKPLKYWIHKKGEDSEPPTEIGHTNVEEEYITNEILPDFTVSAEEHIFPAGRFKCLLCGKAYFTTIGLNAHLELHLPKKAATKKKRIRGPNKKRRRTKADAAEADRGEDTKDTCPAPQMTETADETAAETETEALPSDGRRARKQKPPKPKKIFPCHVCGKQMISASKLRYHMVMHTGEKNYLCTICPKAYSTIYALKHHTRVHTGERPYECKFCGDRFLRPTTLKSHLRRHTGERPYGCNICGKRFIQHSSMTTHIKLNHMDKTIPCPHCDKKYARQTDLNTHLLSHTGDKPFSCKLCPSRFIRQANLNKHMNQHHTDGETRSAKPATSRSKTKNSKKTKGNNTQAMPATVDATFPRTENSDPAALLHDNDVDLTETGPNLCRWNWAPVA